MIEKVGTAKSKKRFSYKNYEGVLVTTVQIKDGEKLDVVNTSDGNRILYLDTNANIRYVPKDQEENFEIKIN